MIYTTIEKGSQYDYWKGRNHKTWVPNARQQMLMDVYRDAKDAGLYYTKDVLAFALKKMEVTQEVAAIGATKVEGGDVGMDMYYARDAYDLLIEREQTKKDLVALNPRVGQVLGSLSVNFKRTNACVVSAVSDDVITITGKRGSKEISFVCGPTKILYLASKAFEKNWRKSPTV